MTEIAIYITQFTCSQCGDLIPDGENRASEAAPVCRRCAEDAEDTAWLEWWHREQAGA